MRTCEEKMVS